MFSYDYSGLDFNTAVTRTELNAGLYESKFEFVDSYLRKKGVKRKELAMIWNDRTMFCYAFLRLDGKPLKLYPYQDIILNDPHRFKYFEASNQIGKSISLDVDAVFDFVHDHGYGFNTAIVSKSLPQATHQMRRIKSLLNSAKFSWKENKGETDNMSVISLDIKDKNGKLLYTNYLIVAPSSEGLLGYDLHKLHLDEFEFWDVDTKYFYEQVAEPRTYHTKGSVQIFSNPNGQESYGAELTQVRLPDGSRKFHVYNFNYLDKPGNTQNDLEIAKAGKTRNVVESTLLAVRSISSRNYFSPDEIESSLDENLTELDMVSQQPIFFLDVGAKVDASVLVGGFIHLDEERLDAQQNPIKHFKAVIIHRYPVGYPLSRVIGDQKNIDENDGWHHEKSVFEYYKEWSKEGIIARIGVDATGNSGIVPYIESLNIPVEDVIFSGPRKSGMYQRAKYLFEKRLIHRIKHPQLEYELAHMEMKKSARGYLMVHHATETDHDDCVDALVGFIHLADDFEFTEPTITQI